MWRVKGEIAGSSNDDLVHGARKSSGSRTRGVGVRRVGGDPSRGFESDCLSHGNGNWRRGYCITSVGCGPSGRCSGCGC